MAIIKFDIDPALLNLLKNGDHRAFEQLFERYAQKVFVFSLTYLKDEDEAQEVVQEVFLKIWLNRTNLKTDTSFQSYLFTIAFNLIRKSFNRKARNDQYMLEAIDTLDAGQDVVDYETNYGLITEKLEQFIGKMPEKRKKIFILRKKQGRSVREIAEEMGISVKTVENQITEAMKYLKTRFEEELPGGMLFFVLFVDHP